MIYHLVLVIELLSTQGIGGSKFRKHMPYPRFASGNGRTAAAAAPDRGERRRSLQHASPLASLPRIVQGHRRHPLHRRSYKKRRGFY